MLLFQFLYMHVAGWMGVLCDNLDLKRGCLKHSFLKISFLQSRHILVTKKKTISASSLERQILSLERQRREVILNLPLTYVVKTSKANITISVTCLGQEIIEYIITVTLCLHCNWFHLPVQKDIVLCFCEKISMWRLLLCISS